MQLQHYIFIVALKACAQAPCQAEARRFIITHLILPQVQKRHVGFGQYVEKKKKKKSLILCRCATLGALLKHPEEFIAEDTFEEFLFLFLFLFWKSAARREKERHAEGRAI